MRVHCSRKRCARKRSRERAARYVCAVHTARQVCGARTRPHCVRNSAKGRGARCEVHTPRGTKIPADERMRARGTISGVKSTNYVCPRCIGVCICACARSMWSVFKMFARLA